MRLGPAGAADFTYSGTDLKEKLSRLTGYLKAFPACRGRALFPGAAAW